MKLYYKASLPDGSNSGNNFTCSLSDSTAEFRITLRPILDKTLLKQIPNAKILYDSKKIPANNSAVSGISDVHSYQTFTINVDDDSIQCTAFFSNAGTLGVINTVPSVKFAVNNATGRFRKIKRVTVFNDNDGKAPWNTNGVKFARKIVFYKN